MAPKTAVSTTIVKVQKSPMRPPVGFLLLVPAVRGAVYRFIRARVEVRSFSTGRARPRTNERDDIIEGSFEEVDAPREPDARPSGWTRH